MDKNLINQLNDNAKRIELISFNESGRNEGETNANKVVFYCNENFENAVKRVAPYLKVAVFCKQNNFFDVGKNYIDKLNNLGNKTVCYLFEENYKFCVSSACGVFNLAEDVRAVLVVDPDLYDFALYFSTVRGIDVIFIADCLYPEMLSAKLFVPNGEFIDEFSLKAQRHVVLNDFNQTKNNLYSIITQFSLCEYFAFSFINGKIISLAVEDCLNTHKLQINAESLFAICYFNLLGDGVIFENSCISEFKYLTKERVSEYTAVVLIEKIINALMRNKQKELLDYNVLAKKVHLLSGEKLIKILDAIKGQLKLVETKKGDIMLMRKIFLLDAKKVLKMIKQTIETSKQTNLVNQKKINSVCSVAGYSVGINAFTIIKETII